MRSALLLLLPFSLLACAATPGARDATAVAHVAPPGDFAPPVFKDPARRTKIAAAVPKLDAAFADVFAKKKLPALAVGLVVDGDLVWSKGYGTKEIGTNAPVDADTVFRIGSITKTFTAVAALQLRDAGRLSLDEPASTYVPELANVVYPTSDSPPITARMLLEHVAGLPRLGAFSYTDPKKPPTEADVLGSLRGFALTYTPSVGGGEYSNLGGALAGIVVGHAAGMRYRDYVSTYLLGPLGMASSTWDPESVAPGRLAVGYADDPKGNRTRAEHWRLGASEGAGGLYSTVHDMARWTAMHLQAFPPRSDDDRWPVRRATLREAMTTQRDYGMHVASVKPVDADAAGIGFAWQTLQDCALEDVVWHNGGTEGYSSMVAMLPYRGVAVIALTNLFNADLDEAVFDALHRLDKEDAIPRREPPTSPALVETRDRLLRLLQHWDDPTATALLEPSFVESLGGVEKVHAFRDTLGTRVGVCTAPEGDIDTQDAATGAWVYACERGSINVRAVLSSKSPVRIGGLMVHSVPAPTGALAAAAARVAALTAKWDDATYDDLLFPTYDKAEMKQFFAGVGHDAGACTLGRAIEREDASSAKWALTCAHGGAQLELSLDPNNGRVGKMVVTPVKDEHARCPK